MIQHRNTHTLLRKPNLRLRRVPCTRGKGESKVKGADIWAHILARYYYLKERGICDVFCEPRPGNRRGKRDGAAGGKTPGKQEKKINQRTAAGLQNNRGIKEMAENKKGEHGGM